MKIIIASLLMLLIATLGISIMYFLMKNVVIKNKIVKCEQGYTDQDLENIYVCKQVRLRDEELTVVKEFTKKIQVANYDSKKLITKYSYFGCLIGALLCLSWIIPFVFVAVAINIIICAVTFYTLKLATTEVLLRNVKIVCKKNIISICDFENNELAKTDEELDILRSVNTDVKSLLVNRYDKIFFMSALLPIINLTFATNVAWSILKIVAKG